jgi:hypothetical protein
MTFIPNVSGIVSTINSSSTPLGSGGVFTGTAEIVTKYATVDLSIDSNVGSAACGVQIQFSSDGTNWDIKNSYTYYSTNTFSVSIMVQAKYMRVVYTNTTAVQSSFRLQTILHISKQPSNTALIVQPIPSLIDAFGRIRVSNNFTLLEMTHVRGLNPFQMTSVVAGTGTITLNANSPYVTLAVTTNADSVKAQSRARGIYQPGKSLLVFNTGVINAASNATGVTSRIGYYDDNDGLYFEHQGNGAAGSLFVVIRTSGSGSVVNTSTAQSAWNIDKMDGTGTSGITIDSSKSLIFMIDFEWLGVGRIRFGTVIGGAVYYIHEINNANINTLPYMNCGSQPCRYEITSTSGAGSQRKICSTVISEGGFTSIGRVFSASYAKANLKAVNTPLVPIMSLRLKTTSNNPKVNVLIKNLSFLTTTASIMNWRLYIFRDLAVATFLTGGAWVSADAESAIEYNLSATAVTVTNGQLVTSGFVYDSNLPDFSNLFLENQVFITSNISGLTDVAVFCSESMNLAESAAAAITWSELL